MPDGFAHQPYFVSVFLVAYSTDQSDTGRHFFKFVINEKKRTVKSTSNLSVSLSCSETVARA